MLSKRNVGRSDRHLQMTSVHYNFEKSFYEIILHEFDYFYVAKVLYMIICGNRAFSKRNFCFGAKMLATDEGDNLTATLSSPEVTVRRFTHQAIAHAQNLLIQSNNGSSPKFACNIRRIQANQLISMLIGIIKNPMVF